MCKRAGDDGKIKAEYVPTGNRGLMQIIKDFDEVGEGEMFLHYVLAKRSQGIIEQNAKFAEQQIVQAETLAAISTVTTRLVRSEEETTEMRRMFTTTLQNINDRVFNERDARVAGDIMTYNKAEAAIERHYVHEHR